MATIVFALKKEKTKNAWAVVKLCSEQGDQLGVYNTLLCKLPLGEQKDYKSYLRMTPWIFWWIIWSGEGDITKTYQYARYNPIQTEVCSTFTVFSYYKILPKFTFLVPNT